MGMEMIVTLEQQCSVNIHASLRGESMYLVMFLECHEAGGSVAVQGRSQRTSFSKQGHMPMGNSHDHIVLVAPHGRQGQILFHVRSDHVGNMPGRCTP